MRVIILRDLPVVADKVWFAVALLICLASKQEENIEVSGRNKQMWVLTRRSKHLMITEVSALDPWDEYDKLEEPLKMAINTSSTTLHPSAIKGIGCPQIKVYSQIALPQVVLTLFVSSFFSLLNTKQLIWKSEVTCSQQSSKIFFCVQLERKSNRWVTCNGWVNDRIHLGVNYPFNISFQ